MRQPRLTPFLALLMLAIAIVTGGEARAQSLIFAEDFESGDLLQWSTHNPRLVVQVLSPTDGNATTASTVDVVGKVYDTANAPTIDVNGVTAVVTGTDFVASDVPLFEGSNNLVVNATSGANNAQVTVAVVRDSTPPLVSIDSPLPDTETTEADVLVTGTVSEPFPVHVNGVEATLDGLNWSVTVHVREGSNVLLAEVFDLLGNQGTDTVSLFKDSTPPLLTVSSPADDSVVATGTTTVTGTVFDAASGLVNAGDGTVIVNGIEAQVGNGSWAAFGVPIVEGEGTITAVAMDRLGNTVSVVHNVLGNSDPAAQIRVVSGDGQAAQVESALAQPLVTVVRDNANNPIANADVVFTVARGDGVLGNGGRTQTVTTDAMGQASVTLTLGSRTGVASDRVEARLDRYFGVAGFCATATPADSRRVIASDGVSQRGFTNTQPLHALDALVVDEHGNPVAGETVTFEVVRGSGTVGGSTSAAATTNDDGHATIALTLGSEVGVRSQVVEASVVGADDPAVFTATTVAGSGARFKLLKSSTTVSGVVLDNENDPVENATVSLVGTDPLVEGVTDAEGRFSLNAAPGPALLHIEGSTAFGDDAYPSLEFELDFLPGIDNAMDRPIYLPVVDSDGLGMANPDTDVVLTRADTPGFSLTVKAGSATFADGSKTGEVQVIRVNRDKIPMPPPDGTAPAMPISIQPATAHFDPPAILRLPNTAGRAPGAVSTLYSFDHDAGAFVAVATMRVTEDGAFVESEPGTGPVKGGWHYVPPEPANTSEAGNELSFTYCDRNDGTNCWSCRFDNTGNMSSCDCNSTPKANGQEIANPDFGCIRIPLITCGTNRPNCSPLESTSGDEIMPTLPCDIAANQDLFINGQISATRAAIEAAMGVADGEIFKPDDALCVRLWAPNDPFAGMTGDFRCRYPTVDNPLDLPVCCPVGHWNGELCCINSVDNIGDPCPQ